MLVEAITAILLGVGFADVHSGESPGRVRVPVVRGPWWTIATNPDLGELTDPKQEPVDFAIWPAADGTWQLWSCIRKTKCPGNTRLFYRWEGRRLTDRDWRPMGIAMRADDQFGEMPGGLQAPFVFKAADLYHMVYGDWERICHATGKDGKAFERVVQPDGKTGMFGEGQGANTRDPMVLRVGDQWHCYYTACPNRVGSVYCRTSSDLRNWSEARIVARGGQAGSGPGRAECPFVIEREGYYYLLRTQAYGRKAQTSVYRSKDPMDFGVDDDRFFVGVLPVAAPEIVVHEGRHYLAALLPDLKGIRLAELAWEEPAASRQAN